MSVWGELLLTYAMNCCWQGVLIAMVAWLTARWLRGAGPAAVCWVWRVALSAMVLLPLGSTALVISGHESTAVADGTGPGAHWLWMALASYAGLTIAGKAWRVYLDWRAVGRMRNVEAELPEWAQRAVERCGLVFPLRHVTVLKGEGEAAYAAGWRRPVLVLPERYFSAVEIPGMESIVGHELAHIERHDYAWNLLLEAVTALAAFHPAVPWMKAHANLAREEACDALVVRRLVPAVNYAEDLLRFARASLGTALPRQVMTILERDTLEARLRSLLSPARSVSARAAIARVGAVVLAIFAVSGTLPWHTLRIDFAPAPQVRRLASAWVWAPPPPPPAPPPPAR